MILVNCTTDWIQAISAAIAIPGAIVAFIFLFRKDKDKEEQIKQLTNIAKKFDAQNSIMQDGNDLLKKQVNILQDIFVSQIEASEGSKKLADIEEEKFLLSIRPNLFSNGGSMIGNKVKFIIENYGEVAYLKSVKDISGEGKLKIVTIFDDLEIPKDGDFVISTITTNGKNINSQQVNYNFEIQYFDKVKNLYKQNLFGTVGENYSMSEPELIERVKNR